MTIEKMIDTINSKISGLKTLDLEFTAKKTFGRSFWEGALYLYEYPKCQRIFLKSFINDSFEEFEADVVEELFDIIITEKYKEWRNYDLVQKNEES